MLRVLLALLSLSAPAAAQMEWTPENQTAFDLLVNPRAFESRSIVLRCGVLNANASRAICTIWNKDADAIGNVPLDVSALAPADRAHILTNCVRTPQVISPDCVADLRATVALWPDGGIRLRWPAVTWPYRQD